MITTASGIMAGDGNRFCRCHQWRIRSSAFESGSYIMDYLKTRAPFWKKRDSHAEGDRWSTGESDQARQKRL
ncbi:hypothetical protein LAD67_09660 [Escherichia coli]|nr:hypothetical protein [Escherichia coli]